MSGVLQVYQEQLLVKGFQSDEAQLMAVTALERCAQEWAQFEAKGSWLSALFHKKVTPKGVYLYGGVGRGKSFLMDCFFESVQTPRKTRLHFHEFMREVHHELRALQGTVNPLNEMGRKIAERYDLICFDEFHVSDITDAMILHRLLQSLFDHQVGFVTTSNFHPNDLYPDGLHRDRLLPAIALLNEQLQVVRVDAGVDYRQMTLEQAELYLCPNDEQSKHSMAATFERLCAHDPLLQETLTIESRDIRALKVSKEVVWFDFETLCAGPRSQHDYLEIAERFQTVFLSDVPQMNERMASQARRFTWLIDVLYDRRVKLVMSAQVSPEQLYLKGPLVHEFARTISRLTEMHSQEFLALDKRDVDTALV
jgi:cell division protein ZapE